MSATCTGNFFWLRGYKFHFEQLLEWIHVKLIWHTLDDSLAKKWWTVITWITLGTLFLQGEDSDGECEVGKCRKVEDILFRFWQLKLCCSQVSTLISSASGGRKKINCCAIACLRHENLVQFWKIVKPFCIQGDYDNESANLCSCFIASPFWRPET